MIFQNVLALCPVFLVGISLELANSANFVGKNRRPRGQINNYVNEYKTAIRVKIDCYSHSC